MKILVRCGMLPFEEFRVEEVLRYDSIGTNSGNLLFQYSVIKALSTKNTQIYSDRYKIAIEDADYINENFDCYVLPLADAFRPDFIGNLRRYTNLIRKLNIPVYVIGVGLRTDYEPQLLSFDFDEDVKEFVKAVLQKSSCIGVRGSITAKYLSELGFIEGKDHIVIGCPSMYSKGDKMNIRELDLKSNSLITINGSRITSKDTWERIFDFSNEFLESHFIPQEYDELFLTYMGGPSVTAQSDKFPGNYNSHFYKNGNVKFFINAKEWYKFMDSVDFSIGTRIHGNIAATISGSPSLTIAIDSRMRELAEFHNLPMLSEREFLEFKDVKVILDKFDFNSPEKKHKENFENFKRFLRINSLDSIYDNVSTLELSETELNYQKYIKPISTLEINDILKRLEFGVNFRKNKFEVSKENWTLYKELLNKGILKKNEDL